jgi:hypothetical protein
VSVSHFVSCPLQLYQKIQRSSGGSIGRGGTAKSACTLCKQMQQNSILALWLGAGDLVEEVKLIDDFTNKKTGRTSNCFRIAYRSNERCDGSLPAV